MSKIEIYHSHRFGYEAVNPTFSWPAFFFTALWAIYHRMWGVFFAIVAINLAIDLVPAFFDLSDRVDFLFMPVVYLVLSTLLGIKGHDWRRTSLIKRGFKKVDEVRSDSGYAAITTIISDSGRGSEIKA